MIYKFIPTFGNIMDLARYKSKSRDKLVNPFYFLFKIKFLNQTCAWFFEITLMQNVCVYAYVCVCVHAPKAINN